MKRITRFTSDSLPLTGPLAVRLDGRVITEVLVADVKKGFVVRGRTDECGRLFVEPGKNRIATESLRGRVTVEPLRR